jgi:long-chain acyl-CoA synthetase
LREGRQSAAAPTPQTLDSVAFLQYTGGTTGLSKGAVLTHRNIVAAILQAEAWFTPALGARRRRQPRQQHCRLAAVSHLRAHALPAGDRWGSHMTLIPNPRDIGKFVEVLKKRPFHMLPAVNTLFNALLQHPQFRSIDFSHLSSRRPAAWPRPKARQSSGAR